MRSIRCHSVCRGRRLGFILLLLPLSAEAQSLNVDNHGLTVTWNSVRGSLLSVTNRLTTERYELTPEPLSIQTSAGVLSLDSASNTRRLPDGVEFAYEFGPARVVVRNELPAGNDFLRQFVSITNIGRSRLVVHRIAGQKFEFSPAFQQIHPHYDPSTYHWLINLFLRSPTGGFYLGVENPIFKYWTKGVSPAKSWIQLEYDPNKVLQPGTSYVSDAFFIGAFRKEKVYLFKELGKLAHAVRQPRAVPTALNFEQEILDWGEVWAMQDFIRTLQPAHDTFRPGFYVRAVAMVGGRKTAEMGEQSGFHIAFGPQHMAGSKQFVDDIARLGHIPHIEWATEWFGVGGYGNPTEKFQLENSGPGDHIPVNPFWEEVVKYGWQKGIQTGIFETVTRNFARIKHGWKVLLPDGKPWTWGKAALPVNCWANREYVQWRLDTTDQAIKDFKLYMVAWDAYVPADWSWLGWPDLHTECHATDHGHLPGDISYPVFRNIIWFLEELQKRHPRAALRVASGLTTAYPWALKNLIEYHPNFYDGETGATYWTSYNFRFLPMYKSGVLLSAESRADFEWLLLRSLSVSDHLMLWPDAVPIALENLTFWTKWLDWADEQVEYLRVGRTLFREPWGDNIVASLPPALEGRLPADSAALHGSAHCIKDRGFLFLFNPSASARVGAIPVNHWIGLSHGEQFLVRQLHPQTGATYGPYRRGEELRVEVPARGVLVIEVAPVTASMAATKPPVSASAMVDKAFLKWEEIPWTEIQPVP
jgi:hypothetical protein